MKTIGINPKTNSEYNVLIADPSAIERKLLNRFLLLNSFKVLEETENPRFILENTNSYNSSPDILFLDPGSLGKEGASILKLLSAKYPSLKIIYLLSNKNQEAQFIKNKINHYLKKPYLKKEMEEKLVEILTTNSIEMGKGKDKILLKDVFIPPLPTAVSSILNYESAASGGSHDLEKILYPDKSLCTDILRVANSSLYGRNGSIKTLQEAITLLGLKTIKNIAFVQARRHLSGNLLKVPLFKKYLYELPTLSSLISFDIVTSLGKAKDYKEIFLMSSFCKIGMNILALNLQEEYRKVLTIYDKGDSDLIALETIETSLNHIQISNYVLEEWKMPEIFISISKNQGFGLNAFEITTEIDKFIRAGEILSKNLFKIKISDEEYEILNRLKEIYKFESDLLDLFGDDYFQLVVSHPFFTFF